MKIIFNDMKIIFNDMKIIFNDMKIIFNDMKIIFNDMKIIFNDMKIIFNDMKIIFNDMKMAQPLTLYNQVLGYFPMYSGSSRWHREPGELNKFSFSEQVMLDQHLANILPLL